MNKYEKVKSLCLEEGEQITVITRDDVGNIQCLQRKYHSVSEYIPYEDAPSERIGAILKLINKVPDKRYYYRNVTAQYFQEIIIYKGWVEIDLDDIIYIKKENPKGELIRHLKYPSYVSTPFIEIAEKYPDNIILCDI